MADSLPASLVVFLHDVVAAFETVQAQIADLQSRVGELEKRVGDQAPEISVLKNQISDLEAGSGSLKTTIASLVGHAETVVGEAGLMNQLGDLNGIAALRDQLAAAMPAETPAPVATSIEPANGAEPQTAAA